MKSTGTRVWNTRFFHELDQQLQADLISLGVQHQYNRGETVIHAGCEGSGLHILLEGRAKVYRRSHGKQLCLSILESGDLFGELSMIDEGETTANISAIQNCTVLSLDREIVFEHLQSNKQFLRQFLEYVSLRLRNVIDDVCSIALDDVYGRLRRILMRLSREGGDDNRIPSITHLELAEMVGSSREMVSIIIKELRLGDYLRTDGRRITLLRELPERR